MITLKVNDLEVLTDSKFELARSAIMGIMATKNVDSKTVKDSLTLVGGMALADSLETLGDSNDVIEVHEDSKPRAKYSRKNLVNRIRVALNVNDWNGEIYTEKSEKTAPAEQIVTGLSF